MQVIKTEASEDRRETMVFRHVLAPLAKSFAQPIPILFSAPAWIKLILASG